MEYIYSAWISLMPMSDKYSALIIFCWIAIPVQPSVAITLRISAMFTFTEAVPYSIFLLFQVTGGKIHYPGPERTPVVVHQQHLFEGYRLIGLKWLL